MKTKAKINYWVDIMTGIAFVLSVLSGLILLFAGPGGGYQGGRNPQYQKSILFVSRNIWKELHNWSSILMALGVLGHFVLHWNWIVCMTRKLFGKSKLSRQTAETCSIES